MATELHVLTEIGTSAKWLASAGKSAAAAWRILSRDRSLLCALLPRLGRKIDARKLRETLVAQAQDTFKREIKSLSRHKDSLMGKLLKATPTRRAFIQRDLEYIESRQREVEIKFAAYSEIIGQPQQALADSTSTRDQISGCWMDQFNELVRRQNEGWRGRLLRDSLVKEALVPGTISPRALWLIGVLEPVKFECLAGLLNIASTIDDTPVILGDHVRLKRQIVPGLEAQALNINRASVALSDTGLLEHSGVAIQLPEGEKVTAAYSEERVQITAVGLNANIGGIHFTSLGKTIAGLYQSSPNDFGRKLFADWMSELSKNEFSIQGL